MPRLSDLLHRPFGDLDVADVEEIVRRIGDPRETLFFERKRQLPNDGLAKSCAAFANTHGGLLLVGVADTTDELVGIEPIGEAQLRVKDVLRGNVVPLPPFQARWLDLPDRPGRGLLLVLVEESSTTPHLLTRNGAIYRRNPGSSDPVPVADQATLFELTRRGTASVERARTGAREIPFDPEVNEPVLYTLGLAATGPEHNDIVHRMYVDPELREEFGKPADLNDFFTRSGVRPVSVVWSQNRVRFHREVGGAFADERRIDSLLFDSGGAVGATRSALPGPRSEQRGPLPLNVEEEIAPWFAANMRRGRELLGLSGSHGDLYASCGICATNRNVFYERDQAALADRPVHFEYRLSLEGNETENAAFIDYLRLTVRRAIGARPPR